MNENRLRSKMEFYKTYAKTKQGVKIYKGSILKDDEFLREGMYLRGVSCFVIDENGNVVVEKRGNTNITKGKLDLCSGHVDNNETTTQAMIREYVEELHSGEEKEKAREEAIHGLKKLDELDLIFPDGDKKRNFFIQFYALNSKIKEFTPQTSEVAQIVKIPMEELFEMMRQGKTKFPYDARFEKLFEQVRKIYNKQNNIENENEIYQK